MAKANSKRVANFALTESQAQAIINAAYGAVVAIENDTALRHYVDKKSVMKAIAKICKSFNWSPIEDWVEEDK